MFLGLMAAHYAYGAVELLPPGNRPMPPGTHALTGGVVIPKPGERLDPGIIVIREGRIQAVGKDVAIPPDARVWDVSGKTIYAGFVDCYWPVSGSNAPAAAADRADAAARPSGGVAPFFGVETTDAISTRESSRFTAERRAATSYVPRSKSTAAMRELGFTAALVVPSQGILRGTSTLVALTDGSSGEALIRSEVFQHVAFETRAGERRSFPGSLMGVIASIRQAFFDARHYAEDQSDYARHPADRSRPAYDVSLEALLPACQKRLPVLFEPGSALMVWRAAQLATEIDLRSIFLASGQEWRRPDLLARGSAFIVPINFPVLPKMPEEGDWSQVTLDQLRAWDWAPENLAVLSSNGCQVALTSSGLSNRKTFRRHLQLSIARGFSEEDALAALTTVPARLCEIEAQLGTIEPGKIANLTVISGGSYFDPENKVSEVWIDGRVYREPERDSKTDNAEKEESEDGTAAVHTSTNTPAPGGTLKASVHPADKNQRHRQLLDLQSTRLARSPLADRGPLVQPRAVLIQNATLWTCTETGRLDNSDLLIVDGRIATIGSQARLRSDYPGPPLIIDAKNWHVTPGLIDAHSHTAILGDVNEMSLPSTAMVRIQDVVNSETDNLYQQLAGGVTAVNLLHGSANCIGGQSCVIKLRDGASPAALSFEGAPGGIKFALGENPKQSGAGDRYTSRFPQTRMGVAALIANRFTAAKQYLAEWDKHSTAGGLAPRRDLELEAIGEILEARRWIHCHSYRQDEILMLIRLMESFNVRVGTFQHVLEGYKVADEIARHGAGASAFSDWWAYKFEVYDAIPYNGSLLRERGVTVSFNSDSSELARRLNIEAAKAVKYGATSETEALKFVTLNPAKQLRVDNRVGSLKPGKDADLAIWSGSPLDTGSVCLQTWVDGKKYFDRALAPERSARLTAERIALLAKAKKCVALVGGGGAAEGPSGENFFEAPLERQYEGQDRHCLEEER
jgi:imidazolonepropionase-like amidohydrolase